MKYASVCSGIEAPSLAWKDLGWTPLWFSEIDPFPCAVLAHHYPAVPNLGDMTGLAARIRRREVEAPDVLVGGCPCQAFSLSGNRESLDDARGNLTLEFVRICDAIDHIRSADGKEPCLVLYENVPGLFTVEDNAFGCLLGGLVGSESPIVPAGGWASAGLVAGPLRSAAWRVLDAQFHGLAQRRERIFVLARSGARGRAVAEALLPLIESVRWHPEPRREAREETARDVPQGAAVGDPQAGARGGVDAPRAAAFGGNRQRGGLDVATACRAKGGTGHGDFESETFLALPVQDTRAGDKGQNGVGVGGPADPAFTLDTTGAQGVVTSTGDLSGTIGSLTGGPRTTDLESAALVAEQRCFSIVPESGQGADLRALQVDTAPAVTTEEAKTIDRGVRIVEPVAFKASHYTRGKDGAPSRIAPPFTADADKGDQDALVCAPAFAFTERGREDGRSLEVQEDLAYCVTSPGEGGRSDSRQVLAPIPFGEVSPTMMARSSRGGSQPLSMGFQTDECIALQPMAFDQAQITHPENRSQPEPGKPCHTLAKENAGRASVVLDWAIRRFTPREVERLMGFPDDFTLIPTGSFKTLEPDMMEYLRLARPGLSDDELARLSKDGPRFKALGNSQAVPVVRWIGEQIARVFGAVEPPDR